MVYATSSYKKLSSGLWLIYNAFNLNELYCVEYTPDNTLLLFDGKTDVKNSYELPGNDLPANLETYESLTSSPEIMTGVGKMTKIKNADDSDRLRFTILVSSNENHFCVLIWERDWSSVAREINLGALKISLVASALLMAVWLLVLHMYRKYAAERLRSGIEREKSKAEIEICRKIQLSQLPEPKNEFACCPEADVSVFVQPSKEVGGDFCDCFMIGENKIGLIIADVSDKGLPAAMFMMMAKSLIRSEMKQGNPPEEVLRKVNCQLSERNDAGMFVTVWLAEIDIAASECRMVNAGHENPVIKRSGCKWEMLRSPHDMPAGILNEATYSAHIENLEDGDMIFVYTDGVTDALNTKEERFGENRITHTLNKLSCTEPGSVIKGLFSEIVTFSAGTEQYEDIGMVCFRYHCPKTKKDKEG
jgi:serine phosphatase RsbU (regulator of sigma subunit)